MNKVILVLFIMCLAALPTINTSYAQEAGFKFRTEEDQSHLMPIESVLGQYDIYRTKYELKVRELFDKGYDRDVVLRMACLPSFTPEWLVGLRKHNGIYTVLLLKAEEQVSNAMKYREVKVNETSEEIEPDLAKSLVEVWQGMLTNAKRPEGVPIGHDGARYYFSMNDNRTGMIWSPHEETNTGILVSICNLLAEYTEAADERRVDLIKDIKGKVTLLKERLNNLPQ